MKIILMCIIIVVLVIIILVMSATIIRLKNDNSDLRYEIKSCEMEFDKLVYRLEYEQKYITRCNAQVVPIKISVSVPSSEYNHGAKEFADHVFYSKIKDELDPYIRVSESEFYGIHTYEYEFLVLNSDDEVVLGKKFR